MSVETPAAVWSIEHNRGVLSVPIFVFEGAVKEGKHRIRFIPPRTGATRIQFTIRQLPVASRGLYEFSCGFRWKRMSGVCWTSQNVDIKKQDARSVDCRWHTDACSWSSIHSSASSATGITQLHDRFYIDPTGGSGSSTDDCSELQCTCTVTVEDALTEFHLLALGGRFEMVRGADSLYLGRQLDTEPTAATSLFVGRLHTAVYVWSETDRLQQWLELRDHLSSLRIPAVRLACSNKNDNDKEACGRCLRELLLIDCAASKQLELQISKVLFAAFLAPVQLSALTSLCLLLLKCWEFGNSENKNNQQPPLIGFMSDEVRLVQGFEQRLYHVCHYLGSAVDVVCWSSNPGDTLDPVLCLTNKSSLQTPVFVARTELSSKDACKAFSLSSRAAARFAVNLATALVHSGDKIPHIAASCIEMLQQTLCKTSEAFDSSVYVCNPALVCAPVAGDRGLGSSPHYASLCNSLELAQTPSHHPRPPLVSVVLVISANDDCNNTGNSQKNVMLSDSSLTDFEIVRLHIVHSNHVGAETKSSGGPGVLSSSPSELLGTCRLALRKHCRGAFVLFHSLHGRSTSNRLAQQLSPMLQSPELVAVGCERGYNNFRRSELVDKQQHLAELRLFRKSSLLDLFANQTAPLLVTPEQVDSIVGVTEWFEQSLTARHGTEALIIVPLKLFVHSG